MGEVYRAHDSVLKRDVAVKVLPSFLSQDADRVRRFEQEARAAAALNHPNILAVFQMGTHEDSPYLVSELLEGSTLREQLLHGPLSLRKAIDYGVQIARGLAAAHERGIAHRDLKPENLFVTKDGRIKILDFGLAKLIQPQAAGADQNAPTVGAATDPGIAMGTVGYMAPEQVRGKSVDHRADIFALGTILYEILTGKRAFQKATSVETMTAILNEEPPPVSQFVRNVPLAFQRVVHRCLEKNAEQRFQSASDLAFGLDALSDSGASASVAVQSRQVSRRLMYLALVAIAALLIAGVVFLMRPQSVLVPTNQWVQLTNFPDSVSQPALSPDGRMLTFVRGDSTFVAPGEIYVKILPSGEPVQLTHDRFPKMGPVFSPDGSRIAYTTLAGFNWDTWVVPVLGGAPERWLPNASGLGWVSADHVMFSEINSGEHMAVVTAAESRSEWRNVYVPPTQRGMAHRSYLSPDGRWVLLAEMDNGEWLPCRVVPFTGHNAGHKVGLPDSPCTSAAWSLDGKWMYLSLHAHNNFHIWKQRFPDGEPQQITSGPSDEEGIAFAPDGRSLITSSGLRQRTVSLHDGKDDHRISLEGYAYRPTLSPDGKKLYYRVLKGGTSPMLGASELWVADLDSGRTQPLFPGIVVTGYQLSPDGNRVLFSANDSAGKSRLWIAPTDRSGVPRQIPNAEGDMPFFGPPGEVVFHSIEGKSTFAFRIHEDGSGMQKLTPSEISQIHGVSPDGELVIGWSRVNGQNNIITKAFPISGTPPTPILNAICFLQWQADRRLLYLSVTTGMNAALANGHTYVIPLAPSKLLPNIPPGGFHSEAEIAALPGVRVLEVADVGPGRSTGTYAFSRQTVQRNLYRVPLP